MESLKLIPQDRQSIDFAESERQKSKNLFNNLDTVYTVGNNGTLEKTETGFIANNPQNNGRSITVYWYENLKAGVTYTISFRLKFETEQRGHYPTFRINDEIIFTCQSYDEFQQFSHTITPESDGEYELEFICSNSQAAALSTDITYVEDIQIEEGSVATSYVSYQGGRFIQEGDIAGVEHVKTVYDMLSSDASLNLGLTSGIVSGGSTASIDFSKYKRVIVTAVLGANACQFEIDLTSGVTSGNRYAGGGIANRYVSGDNVGIICCFAQINSNKTIIYNLFSGISYTTNDYTYTNDGYYISKIKGVF